MTTYPADEKRISEVERGLSWNAILPCDPDKSPVIGDFIIFALATSDANRETCFVSGGDSVRVLLTEVTDLATNDPATGHSLFRLSWAPLGQRDSPPSLNGNGRKAAASALARTSKKSWFSCSPRPKAMKS